MSPLEPSQLKEVYTWLFGLGIALFVMFVTGSALLLARNRSKPTPEQIAEREAAKRARIEQNRLRAAIRQEARWLMREIPHHLAIQQKFETFYREGVVSSRQRYRGGA